ncbi:hypothetical protein Pth03_26530 [Planotetraspora thailandica]|uniref:Uncharacterized protein n=1 Tax=Planotetraspora thailandica TaxID=487172 RepID=A0A8J3UY92_9ACTN|nr:hypothetical protein [Planotetraspora thailandica]GII54264.1 hypothetical protein Pth03_26530 [Planotetraspora thailandica]
MTVAYIARNGVEKELSGSHSHAPGSDGCATAQMLARGLFRHEAWVTVERQSVALRVPSCGGELPANIGEPVS